VLTLGISETIEDHAPTTDTRVTGTLRRDEGTWHRVLTSLATAAAPTDWSRFFAATAPLDLPTYPFQHQRFWLEQKAAEATAGRQTAANPAETEFWEAVEREDLAAVAGTLDLDGDAADLPTVLSALSSWRRRQLDRAVLDSWRYTISWAPLTDATPTAFPGGTWLAVLPAALGDDPAVRGCLDALRQRRATVIPVALEPGDRDRAALGDRLKAALAEGAEISGVLSLAGLADTDPASAHEPVTAGLAMTTALVQALGDTGVSAPLWCVTQGAVSTGLSDPIRHPLQAQIWGFGRVVALEHPERWGGLIDLPEQLDARGAEQFTRLLAGGSGEDQIALRQSAAFGRRLSRAPLGGSPVPEWRPRGTVLVTGGAGAVGTHVTRWLARAGAPHLLLVGRRGKDTPGIAELEAELTALGSKVTIAAVDVADRDALRGLLDSIPAEFPLSAVVHGAGVLADGIIEQVTTEDLERVLRPKVAAAAALHELTAGLDLDAFVLFSSVVGVLGNGGQSGYAASNAYLDALAAQRRAAGLPATAVAWGSWGGGGMVNATAEERLRRQGVPTMDPDTAVSALAAAVDRQETFVTVVDVDWPTFAPSFTAARPSALLGDLAEVRQLATAGGGAAAGAPAEDAGGLTARLRGLPAREAEEALLEVIRTNAAAVLGLRSPDAINAGRDFKAAGFDSLTAVELRNRLRNATGLQLPTTLLFDYPTPVVLSQYMLDEIFPDRAANGDSTAPDDADESDVRKALMSLSTARLKEAGLLDSLLSLAAEPQDGGGQSPEAAADDDTSSLDTMDLDDLVRMALKNDLS
ncbi:SDR family NAD(P)-dependent oxidoreductase, partial [Streptomyces litchfieldiae]